MARPHKNEDEKREIIVRVRLTKSEKKQFADAAHNDGLTLSDYMRVKTLQATPRIKKATPERAAFIRGLGELGKIGSNVNQIARALNRRDGNTGELCISEALISSTLYGVSTLSRHLITLLENGH